MSEEPETKELVFAATKEYLRFGEFCDACRKYRYIGRYRGVQGEGINRSGREYANWERLSPLFPEELFTLVGRRHLDEQFPHKPFATPGSPAFTEVVSCRTVYYTAPVAATPSRIEREVMALSATLSYLVEAAEQASRGKDDFLLAYRLPKRTELVIVDEAQRRHFQALGLIDDHYDRLNFGLVLVGQPGLERSLARYPQLYSRVGFAHQFRVLSEEETRWLLQQRWSHLGMHIRVDDFTDTEALAAIVRITGGNFRVIHRLLMQIERILEINHLNTVTQEVVEKARERLVLG